MTDGHERALSLNQAHWRPHDMPRGVVVTNVAEAKRAVFQTYPQFRERRLSFLGEGWDFRLFELEERWLFRFPKHENGVVKLARETQLLSRLAPYLSLPVPRYLFAYGGVPRRSSPFAGYEKLPGIPADTAPKYDRLVVARQLASFLGELHSFPVSLAVEAGVRAGKGGFELWRDRALAGVEDVAVCQLAPGRVRAFLQREVPTRYSGEPKLVHNDLWPEHVLIEPETGGISGVIDWGDVILGDPAIDFAGLYTWFGDGWLDLLLEGYPGELDAGIAARTRYLACCMAVHNIALGCEMGRQAWVSAGRRVLVWLFAS